MPTGNENTIYKFNDFEELCALILDNGKEEFVYSD